MKWQREKAVEFREKCGNINQMQFRQVCKINLNFDGSSSNWPINI